MATGGSIPSGMSSIPQDAVFIESILKSMGVESYEPRVINQLLEFAYGYVTDVLEDAKLFSEHASKKAIDENDVRLAISLKLDHSFTAPPPREVLLDMAQQKNTEPMPPIQPYCGLKLPPARYCLTAPNFQLRQPYKTKPREYEAAGSLTSSSRSAPAPILPAPSSLQQPQLIQTAISGSTFSQTPGGVQSGSAPVLFLPPRSISAQQHSITVNPTLTSVNLDSSLNYGTPVQNPLKRRLDDGET